MTSNSSDTQKGPSSSAPQKSSGSPKNRMAEAIQFVTQNQGFDDILVKIEKLRLLKGSDEERRYGQIRVMLEEYATRENVERPLSIAVFGPPGSGKSFGVKQIVKSLQDKFIVIMSANLSQLTATEELAEAFQEKIDEHNKAKLEQLSKNGPKDGKEADLLEVTPVFIFDEFDTPLNGVSLGWLRWFLAPMQDGEFLNNRESVQIHKAVFIFAGGTASSFEEFEERAKMNRADYQEKKVPDFISRLRGFIDVQGINNLDDDREIRRAVVLNYLLNARWPKKRNQGSFPIQESLVERMLANVHFVHGVRSMEALLDMSAFGNAATLGEDQLPDDELKKLHLSRGLLDEMVIGISAGLNEGAASKFLEKLTDALLRNGATLAYGGDLTTDGTLDRIIAAAKKVPDELVKRKDKRIRNYLGFPAFNKSTIKEERSQAETQVRFLDLETLSESERNALEVPAKSWFSARPEKSTEQENPQYQMAWALSLFRMRVRLIQDISALIVLGGKDGESWGRFSGIAEEVMLAIALRKPVYVLGGRGGAARAVGRLLGLDHTIANPDTCLDDVKNLELSQNHEKFAKSFTIPGHSNLPRTIAEVRNYLFDRSITTNAWPWNGLNIDENRKLFTTEINESHWGECVSLIIKGLTRLDWKHPMGRKRRVVPASR